MSQFIVTMQAKSGATFPRGQRLVVDYQGPHGPVKLAFSTMRGDVGLGVETALYLSVTARTEAPSVGEAIAISTTTGSIASALIALATNAAAEPVSVRLAYQLVGPDQQGDYFQRYIPPPEPVLLHHRRVDIPVLQALFPAFGSHEERDRLTKAIDHYRISLLTSRPGQDLVAFNPLWICVEALTPVFLRRELKRSGQSRDQLYAFWGLPSSEHQSVRNRNLDSAIRARLIFRGDISSYKDARTASDGFEHAYMDLGEVHERVSRAKIPTAAHVRRAIIEALNLPSEIAEAACGPQFSNPLERWEYDLAIRDKLTADSSGALARNDRPHPEFEWEHPIQSMSANPDETVSFQLGGNLTAHIADGAKFDIERLEIRGPKVDSTQADQASSKAVQELEVDAGHTAPESKATQLNRMRMMSLMQRVLNAAESVAPKSPIEISHADFKAYEMFWRARSLFDSVRTLVKEGLSDEAFILAAIIYEESLRIGQLKSSGPRRNALALGWIDESLKIQRRLAAVMGTRHGEDPEEMIAMIDRQIEGLRTIAENAGVTQFQRFMPVDEAAAHLNRQQDHWLYELAQDFFRGSHFGQMNRIKKKDDVVAMHAKTGGLWMAGGVIEFAGKALLFATIDMVEMFGRGDADRCRKLITELDALEAPSEVRSD
jgi:hypothetical protein